MVNLRDACTRSIAYPGRGGGEGGGQAIGAPQPTARERHRDSAEKRLLQCPALSDIMWWGCWPTTCAAFDGRRHPGFGSGSARRERANRWFHRRPATWARSRRRRPRRRRGASHAHRGSEEGAGLRRRREGALREATGGRAPGALSTPVPLPAHPPPRPAQDPFVLCLLLRTPTPRFLACRARAPVVGKAARGARAGLAVSRLETNQTTR